MSYPLGYSMTDLQKLDYSNLYNYSNRSRARQRRHLAGQHSVEEGGGRAEERDDRPGRLAGKY